MKNSKRTIYSLLESLDEVFTPGSTKFSDYVKDTSDDNGFLRTAYCKLPERMRNRPVSNKVTYAVIGSEHYIREEDLRCEFTVDPFEYNETKTKLQVSFVNSLEIEDTIRWNKEVGYPICTVIPLRYIDGYED